MRKGTSRCSRKLKHPTPKYRAGVFPLTMLFSSFCLVALGRQIQDCDGRTLSSSSHHSFETSSSGLPAVYPRRSGGKSHAEKAGACSDTNEMGPSSGPISAFLGS